MSVAKPTSWGLKALSRLQVPRMLAAFAIVAGTLASPLIVAPAHAVLPDLTCTVKADITFASPTFPGGTSPATIVGDLKMCASLNPLYSNVKSGHITGSGTASSLLLPCSLLLTIPLTVGVTWSTAPPTVPAPTSTINLNISTIPPDLTGTVASGLLAGDTVLAVPVIVPNCSLAIPPALNSLKITAGVLSFS